MTNPPSQFSATGGLLKGVLEVELCDVRLGEYERRSEDY